MNKKPVLVITKGLPGCGKSTLAKSLAGESTYITNRDELRFALYGKYWGLTSEQESEITRIQHQVSKGRLAKGHNVICDDTNLNPRVAQAWKDLAAEQGADFDVIDLTSVSVETCIERDLKRQAEGGRYVGADVIRGMAERWIK